MVKGKYLNFIVSNVRRSRGQIIAVLLLFVIVTAMLNTFLFLSVDYSQNYPREKARLNGEDVDMLFTDLFPISSKKDAIAGSLDGIDAVREYEIEEVSATPFGSVDFKDAVLSNRIVFMSYERALEKKIGKYDIVESDGDSGVYLSYTFKVDGGYAVGDTVGVYAGKDYSFRVAGFYNSVDTGTTNCTDIVLLLTEDLWGDIRAEGLGSYRVSVLLHEPEKADVLESDVVEKVSEGNPTLLLVGSSSAQKLASSRYVTATIFKAIISAAAILMIAVVLTIISVTLSNYLRNNIRNLGTMKSLGYTSGNLIAPIVCEFSAFALAASVVGVAGSYLLLPVLSSAMEKQVGIPYSIHFMPLEAILSIGISVAVAALSSFLSVVKIKRIAPINAIRENRERGNKGSRVFFPLEKTRLGLNTAISMKTWASGVARNLIIFFSMTGVAFLIGFSCFSYQNVILDQQDILDLVCGQMTDSTVAVRTESEGALTEELAKNEDVERYYLFTSNTVAPKNMPKMYTSIYDSTDPIDVERICIDGRFPTEDGEISVNNAYAKANGVKIGDVLTFEIDGTQVGYHVVGLTQGAYYSGRDCYMTRAGYQRLKSLSVVSYFVDLKDGVDIDAFNRSLEARCDLLYASNYRMSVETVSLSYIRILTIATAVVVILSFVVAGFILYILLVVLLSNKKREHGILKSLGFITRDVIYQTAVSLLPTCALGTVVGLWISRRGVAAILALALNGIGIFSFGTPTRVLYLVAAGAVILFFTTVYSVLLSNSVRYITPHKLFNNE